MISDLDGALLGRARRRVAVLAAAGVLLGVLLAGAVTWFTVTRARDATGLRDLRLVATAAEDADDPPPGVLLVIAAPDGTLDVSPGAPDAVPDAAALDRVARTGVAESGTLDAGGRQFIVYTAVRDGNVVQALEDVAPRETEKARLAAGIGAASAGGLVLALLFGNFLAGRATAPLADALARQRRFVADASHELRTPLARLGLRAQLLERSLPSSVPDEVREDAAQLVRDSAGMAEALTDLLLAAQLRATPDRGEPVDLADVARGAVLADSQRAQRGGVALVAEAEPGCVVTGSRAALVRAVAALVDNSVSRGRPGGRVRVRVRVEGREVRLDVEDDGPGFDAARMEELVRPFARGDDGGRGFGLGLALVSEVVQAHGGRLDARSAPGEGAVVTILLPSAAAGQGPGGGRALLRG